MARQHAESSHALNIFWLRKQGYFPQGYSTRLGTVTWTSGEHESSIGISIAVGSGTGDHMRLWYTHTSSWNGEKSDMDYSVNLATTPCRYGGVRYWFICPLTKNGSYCGRRVGVLYLCGKYYGCRYCGNIAYQSQFESGRYKGFVSIPDIEQAEKEVKRYYYRGKPTRKYRRVMRLNEKFEMGWVMMLARVDKGFAKKFGIAV